MTSDKKIYLAVKETYSALTDATDGLNVALLENGLDALTDIRPQDPDQIEISEGSPDRTMGVYVEGENVFQQGFGDDERPVVAVTVDLILRDSDSEGLKQLIYRYADVVRNFLDSQRIGMQSMVTSQSISRKKGDMRNRVAFLYIVEYEPMTDIDEQGFEDLA
jgi:hypothetical protein